MVDRIGATLRMWNTLRKILKVFNRENWTSIKLTQQLEIHIRTELL